MKIINKILVPTDFSICAENAFQYSLFLAEKLGASITLLHVVAPDYGVTDLPMIVEQATTEKLEVANQLLTDFKNLGQTRTKGLINTMPPIAQSVKISTTVNSAINSTIGEDDIDMVVIGTNSQHSTWDNAFGSLASTVAQQAECHVLVVPEEVVFDNIKSVGFAASLEETDPYYLFKTCKILEAFQPIVRVVHIKKLDDDDDQNILIDEMKDYFANSKVALQLTFHVLEEESIADGLEYLANEWPLDMMAMPSQHRDFLENLFHRSMTKRMALHSKIPLLILK